MKGLYILNRAAVFEAMAKNGIKTLAEVEQKMGASHGAMSYALADGHTTSKRMVVAVAYALNTNVEAIAKLRSEIEKQKKEEPKEETPTEKAGYIPQLQPITREIKEQTALLSEIARHMEKQTELLQKIVQALGC